MGRETKVLVITDEQKSSLELLYKTGGKHSLRQRCKIILLKAEGYRVQSISAILDTTASSVNNWLTPYAAEAIAGLTTKAGQGRKPVLEEEHSGIVRAAVEQERQRLSQAQKIIEENMGKPMSLSTLTRFLKVITALTNE